MLSKPRHLKTESLTETFDDGMLRSGRSKMAETTVIEKLNEEIQDLSSRLKFAMENVEDLNEEITELKKKYVYDKSEWQKHERELKSLISKLASEKKSTEELTIKQYDEIKELNRNFKNAQKLYELQEERAQKFSQIRSNYQSKLTILKGTSSHPLSPTRNKHNDRSMLMKTITEYKDNFDGDIVKLETLTPKKDNGIPMKINSSKTIIGKLKMPHVKPILKGIKRTPLFN